MGLFRWLQGKAGAMSIWDIWALKVFAVLFGIVVGARFAPFFAPHLEVWALATLLFGLAFTVRFFRLGTRG